MLNGIIITLLRFLGGLAQSVTRLCHTGCLYRVQPLSLDISFFCFFSIIASVLIPFLCRSCLLQPYKEKGGQGGHHQSSLQLDPQGCSIFSFHLSFDANDDEKAKECNWQVIHEDQHLQQHN